MMDLASASSILLGVVASGSALYGMINYKNTDNKICTSKELKTLSGDGIKLSENIQLSVKQSNEHIAMIAPSGSGKSRRFIAHNINQLQNCSIIVTDPSCELERMCKTNKKKYVLNLFNNASIGYDPLKTCRNEFEVRKLAQSILLNGLNSFQKKNSVSSQDDWIGMATPLFTAYLLMNFHTGKYSFDKVIENICTMPILSQIKLNDKKEIEYISPSIAKEIDDSKVKSAIIQMNSFLQSKKSEVTLSSIRTVLNSCLQLFLDENVKKLFTRPNINMSKLRKEESIIYIQIPERHSKYFSPLTAIFISQLFDILLDADGLQCYFLLDEFANIGVLEDVQSLLSTCRKHCISLVTAIQNVIQLKALYGELEANNINELFKTVLVCAGLKNESAVYVSDLLGTVDYRGNDKTMQLKTPSEIRMMDENDILIVCNNKRPVIDKMMDIMVG